MDGVLERSGPDWRLRFTRPLAHPAEKVWRAITEPEHLRAWFPDGIKGEWQVGATLTFGSPQAGEFTGEVVAVEPPRLLEYTWGTDRLRFEIEPTGDGCMLTLFDTIDELGKAARDGAGWQVCLEDLVARLDRADPGPHDERWPPLYAAYQEAFGPEASTIGVPS
jgi:uncharacterized protein YndB with AHSA1/START domain